MQKKQRLTKVEKTLNRLAKAIGEAERAIKDLKEIWEGEEEKREK